MNDQEQPKAEVEAQARAAGEAFNKRLKARIALMKKRAAVAAARLLQARDPELPSPKTERELIALVSYMAQTPRKFGVYLTRRDKEALEWFHNLTMARLVNEARLAAEAAEKAQTPVET